jgi:hypothetical protein
MDWNLPEILDVEFLTDEEVEELIKIKANIDDIYTKLETDNKIIEKLQPYITSDAIDTKYISKDLLNTKLDLYLLKSEAGITYVNNSQLTGALNSYMNTVDLYDNFYNKGRTDGKIATLEGTINNKLSTCMKISDAYSAFVTMEQYTGQSLVGINNLEKKIIYLFENNNILFNQYMDSTVLSSSEWTVTNCTATDYSSNGYGEVTIGTSKTVGSLIMNNFIKVDNNCSISINTYNPFNIITDTNKILAVSPTYSSGTSITYKSSDGTVISTAQDSTASKPSIIIITIINNNITCNIDGKKITLTNDDIINNFTNIKLSVTSNGTSAFYINDIFTISKLTTPQTDIDSLQSRVTALEQGLTTLDTYLKS